jgi:hypothetical protein
MTSVIEGSKNSRVHYTTLDHWWNSFCFVSGHYAQSSYAPVGMTILFEIGM